MTFGMPSIAAVSPEVRSFVPAPSIAPIGWVTSNNVACVYDKMSSDDREMALLLFEREVTSGAKIHTGSGNLKVIVRLVDEARAKCSAPYRWSSAQTEAATAYAMNELIRLGATQALEAKGHNTGTIDAYYVKHRADLFGLKKIKATKAEVFEAYLFEHGWNKGETTTVMIAQFYLETLLARDHQIQTFAVASAGSALGIKASRLPNRERIPSRGKP